MAVTAAPRLSGGGPVAQREGAFGGREALGPAEACARGERPESPAGFGA